VKDWYFKYADNGDQYVGRCLCLLPILHVDLAISPPFFSDTADSVWVQDMVASQFVNLANVTEFGLMLRMCLASMLFHAQWIEDSLSFNHVVKNASVCFRNIDQLLKIKEEKWISIAYPWTHPQLVFSGIPPYCSLLQHLAEIKSEQNNFFFVICRTGMYLFVYLFTNNRLSNLFFYAQVKTALQEYGINSGTLTEERVNLIFKTFLNEMNEQLAKVNCGVGVGTPNTVADRVETGKGYKLHVYGGSFHRVPKKWRFPRCGLLALWRQWWVGDQPRQIPPLKSIQYGDVKHLNAKDLLPIELERKVGPNKENRRLVSKYLADMRFMCNYLCNLVVEKLGKIEDIISIKSVDRMFECVEELLPGERDAQKQWATVLRQVRRVNAKKKKELGST
jgi:hypothetical protein